MIMNIGKNYNKNGWMDCSSITNELNDITKISNIKNQVVFEEDWRRKAIRDKIKKKKKENTTQNKTSQELKDYTAVGSIINNSN